MAFVEGFLCKSPILNMALQQVGTMCRSGPTLENKDIGVFHVGHLDLRVAGTDQQLVAWRREQLEIANAQVQALERLGVQEREHEQGMGCGHGWQSVRRG